MTADGKPLPPGDYQVPEPEWIIRGNRVGCKYCGLKFKTTHKYISHFIRRHMNSDGTWRQAKGPNFKQIADPTPEELEALDLEEGLITRANRRVGKNEKPWWQL